MWPTTCNKYENWKLWKYQNFCRIWDFRKCIKYDPKFIWKYDDYFGTSLQLLADNLKNFGYVLVGCNILGVNAFFIKKKLVQNKFPKNTTAKFHYQKFRIGLNNAKSSHIESNKWCN